MRYRSLFFICVWLCGWGLSAQEGLQAYTPSILYKKGEWELKSFYNYYTQSSRFDDNGISTIGNGTRENYATWINQFLIGTGGRFNVGVDLWMKSVSIPSSGLNRTALTGIGPKVKIAPFRGIEKLSYQMTLLFPVADDQEGRAIDADPRGLFLESDKTLWLHQLFYDLPLGPKTQLFFQQSFWYNLVRESFRERNFLQTQTSIFANYFPNSRWTIYGMTEFFPTHYDDQRQSAKAFSSFFVQSGLGAKWQFIPSKLEVEALYTNFWLGSPGSGAGQTFNIGLRWIRQN